MSIWTDDFLAASIAEGSFAFDIEHDPEIDLNINPDLHGVGFSTQSLSKYVVKPEELVDICDKIFYLEGVDAVAHNAKYDIKGLKAVGLIAAYPMNLVDTMIGLNLLNDNLTPKELGLKPTILREFEYQMKDFKDASAFGLDSETFKKYALDDIKWTLRLWEERVKDALEREGLMKLFRKILMPSCRVFSDMERAGIKWDLKRARTLLNGFQRMMEDTEEKVIKEIGAVNMNSPKQLSKRLFDELGYDTTGIKFNEKSGNWSTDARTFDILAEKYPVCQKIKEFRTAKKMLSTYIKPSTERALQSKNHRIHPTFWLVSTTGRTRSSKPNFQNLPTSDFGADLNIRSCIIPEEGSKLIVADLSQIELRVIAHIAKEPGFVKAYRGWKCGACGSEGSHQSILHECPKCGVEENEEVLKDEVAPYFWHGLDLHAQTAESIPALAGNRQAGKITNFAVVYGATATKMHSIFSSFSKRQWTAVIDGFYDAYRNIPLWHAKCKFLMESTGVITDIFGRKRRIKKIDIRKSEKHALNMAVNFAPQASACEMIQLAMANMRTRWVEEGIWERGVKIVNFVHDEIIVEVREENLDSVSKDITYFMENAVSLNVPVRTGLEVCERWSEGK